MSEPFEVPGYRLLELIGRGGMGSVYRATDSTGRPVAVKVLPFLQMTPRAVARFEREAELLARHRHPAIVAVHAWGKTELVCWLACELVEGRHIDAAARELDFAARLDLVERLADAVGAAHAIGVVHRDLKPANLLVDAALRVRVIDFGASTGEGVERLTQTGQFLGTPHWAPPERLFGGKEQDAPTGDVWSIAAIAWEVLTGRSPYPVESPADLFQRNQAPERSPRLIEPRIPPGVADVLVRALDPEPRNRPRDGAALARSLRAGRTSRPWRRAPVLVLGGAAAIGLTAGLLLPRASLPPGASRAAVASEAEPATDLSRAAALAAVGSWTELRALLAGREGLSRELARLRGQAALLGEPADLAAARRDLGAQDPLVAVEVDRAALAALSPRQPSLIVEAIHALVGQVRDGPWPDDPAAREVRRRLQVEVARTLVRLTGLVSWLDDPSAIERTMTATRQLHEGPGGGGVVFAELWVDWCKSAFSAKVNTERWLGEHRGLIPAPERAAGHAPEVQAIALAFHLGAAQDPEEVDSALIERVAPDLARLSEYSLPGALLEREAGSALFRRARALAWRALADGDRTRAAPHLAAGREHLARIGSLAMQGLTRGESRIALSFELLRGDVPAARRHLRPGAINARERAIEALLEVECDLVAGDLEAARQKLAAKPWAGLRRLHARLQLHRRVLAGELPASEALASVPPDEPDARSWGQLIEWHTARGLETVLQGGWWPGKR